MIKCARLGCKWKINEEVYKNNQQGLEEACLLHNKKHMNDEILKAYFMKVKEGKI
jgi:hypothetical protein